ncbi:hypothetical protein BWQ96_00693 [Gracilariopsis chorda]|uniref:DUF3344 domain-containing protein n=1 Tax=Gracilariopsis chorda TaxID=448386 RepID=A0A2V3J5W4_9FLOR|nr:hypothetical protein BWQ96_00693 [Gracilariopsis chorda]|eukprot:PXF49377.1 hypothetical protein BWQ96_00693 [Gracilariopsis chorda]
MERQTIRSLIFLSLVCAVVATKRPTTLTSLFAPSDGNIPRKRCINLGTRHDAVGPFAPELGLIKYRGSTPGLFSLPSVKVQGTGFDHAFVTQRTANRISFVLKVDRRFTYNVALGFAEVNKETCKPNARIMNMNVQGRPKFGVDIYKSAGCRRPLFVRFNHVKPGRLGFITAFVRGIKNKAQIAVVCVERIPGGPGTRVPPVLPQRSSSPTLRPSPSRSPSPSPRASPSRSPTAVLKPSLCRQRDCFTFDGPGDYVVIGNSLSRDEDRDNCEVKPSSSAKLRIPNGARIKKAILYWSASGRIGKYARATLNDKVVFAQKVYTDRVSRMKFYGAWADVTSRVTGNGIFNVAGIQYDNGSPYCRLNAAYAAWSIVVVFEHPNLPLARVNLCANDFTFTFPSGVYTNSVGCVAGSRTTSKARTTLVTFESDGYKGEYFFINGGYLGDNLFASNTAPNLDIRSFDLRSIIRSGASYISYTIKSYYTRTDRFGGAVEGLFMPLRVVYYTLD